MSEQVAAHNLKRLFKLGMICLGTTGILLVAIGTLHLSLSRSHAHLENTYESLLTTHKRLSEVWKKRSTKARRLKKLKEIPQATYCSGLIESIADIMPPKTLLTNVRLDHNKLALEGYAATPEELTSFLIGLSTVGQKDIVLHKSYPTPAGISFTINSCR